MTTECSSTADAITGVLLAGDAVLNLTQQPLNTMAGTLFISLSDNQLTVSSQPSFVQWRQGVFPVPDQLRSKAIHRIVIVADEHCGDAAQVARELSAHGISCIQCTLMSACDANAYMDEGDTDAVTERLRQLGYI